MKNVFTCVALALLTIGCNRGSGGTPTDPSQVTIEFTTSDIVVGTGAQAAPGNRATVNYTLWLYNAAGTDSKGTRVESSLDPGGTPFALTIGAGGVIPGFQQGVVGMRVGGRRRVYIPPSLAYGSTGSGPIPPNASIVFELELVTLVQ